MAAATAGPIVVGVDFSPESRQALSAATAIARQMAAPLHIVAAVEPLLAEAASQAHQLPGYLERVNTDLRAFAAAVPNGATDTSCGAQVGDPASLLTAAADRLRARLIVVGSRGHGRAARFLLGSTTLRVLRSTNHPVLVTDFRDQQLARDEAPAPITRLICGVDFSDGSIAAVRQAATLALELRASLTLVHAAAPGSSAGDAEARLAAIGQKFAPGAKSLVREGDAADVLARETTAGSGDVIVVGLRGASENRPGNTALAVLASAGVPVIGVPS